MSTKSIESLAWEKAWEQSYNNNWDKFGHNWIKEYEKLIEDEEI